MVGFIEALKLGCRILHDFGKGAGFWGAITYSLNTQLCGVDHEIKSLLP
jgi:hypothetical protein